MKRVDTREKDIACLEPLWDTNVEEKLSVSPLLELVAKLRDVRYTHLTCNTTEEFEFNLKHLPNSDYYRILYLAFHGSPGEIHLADKSVVTLEQLASLIGKRFKGWAVHFGSCGTMDTDESRLNEFLEATGGAMAVGYTKDVFWVDSAPMDLILFEHLQRYKNLNSMWKRLEQRYGQLMSLTGMLQDQRWECSAMLRQKGGFGGGHNSVPSSARGIQS